MLFSKGGKLSDLEKRLAVAKHDLEAAQENVVTVAADEDAAAETAAGYASWRIRSQDAGTEILRLNRLIASLEASVAEQASVDEIDAIRERAAAARKTNVALAKRLRSEGPKLSAQIIALVKEVAASTVEAEAINRMLPKEDQRVLCANSLARSREATPREVISEEFENMWVFRSTGNLVGDQDQVRDLGNGSGVLRPASHLDTSGNISCVKRKFKITKFYPALDRVMADEIFNNLNLPNFSGPGGAIPQRWRYSAEDFARDASSEIPSASARQPQTEMTPVEVWHR